MFKTLKEQTNFLQQTRETFDSHQRRARAAGRCVSYRLEDVRALVEKQLALAICPYCRGPLDVATFVLDHKVPSVRGGKFTFKNLEICCRECHLFKGVLDHHEFRELLQLMATWPRPVQQHFRACLVAAADLTPAHLPPVGSLRWFTGAQSSKDQPSLPPMEESTPQDQGDLS
jgi:5-methylcytosine-specific restriction endonuclease McrA